MRSRLLTGIVAATVLLVLSTGCDKRTLFHSYRHVPCQEWNRTDTLTFTIDTIGRDALCRFELELRTTDSYPYRSLWVIVESQFTSPLFLRRDTVECRLMDSGYQHTGSGVHVYQYTTTLPPLPLHKGQTGRVSVRHFMSRERLPGIRDVGLCIGL